MQQPKVVAPEFDGAAIDVIGPAGSFGAILYCEKEGFSPLFRAVKLAERYDLVIISNKGESVTAGRQLIDEICVPSVNERPPRPLWVAAVLFW